MFEKPMEPSRNDTSILLLTSVIKIPLTNHVQYSSTNKTDHHDITEILLKVALSSKTITLKYLLQRSYQNISFVICHKNNSLDTRIHIQLSIKTPSGSDKASTDKGEIINYCEVVRNIAPL
jgi:hypothetical protein